MRNSLCRCVLGVAALQLAACSSSSETGAGGAAGIDGGGGTAGNAGSSGSGGSAGSAGAADAGVDVLDSGDSAADTSMDGPETESDFTFLGKEPESCPLSASACQGWPSDSDGPVYLYSSRQTWDATSFDRTYHVHVPANLEGPAPLVVVLHGGGGSGVRTLAPQTWDDFGGPRGEDGITWRKNTDNCKAKPTEGLLPGYVNEQGTTCLPPAVKAINTRPFVTVFPDGVLDAGETSALGKRHWEDGRVPSPGFGTDTEQRDDVAFLDHVIETLMGDSELDLDLSAIYVTGASNGGMMTLRLVCHFGDPRYPSLSRVAAYLASIGEMPEGLLEGQHGRQACPSQLNGDVGFRIVLGTGIDTPDCTTYPCNSPVVTGDGLMPFGQAGGRYNVYSPDQGRVLSGPDTIDFWQSAFVAGMGNAGTPSEEMLGFFTQRQVLSFSSSVTVLETWVTDGGGHMLNATRMDFMPVGSGWAFLSSFRRESAGLTRVDPDWVTGY